MPCAGFTGSETRREAPRDAEGSGGVRRHTDPPGAFRAAEWPDAETELEAAGLWWRAREEWEAENDRYAFLDFEDPDIPGEPWNPGPWMWLFEKVGEGKRPIINDGASQVIADNIDTNDSTGLSLLTGNVFK